MSYFPFKYSKDYYMKMLGPNSFKKAIEEAEKLAKSLKLRLDPLLVPAYPLIT